MASAASARVHPACINAGNPYHECSEYCFRRIADGRVAGREGNSSAAGKFPNFVDEDFNFFPNRGLNSWRRLRINYTTCMFCSIQYGSNWIGSYMPLASSLKFSFN